MSGKRLSLGLLLLVGLIAVTAPFLGTMRWQRFTPHCVTYE